MPASAGMSVGIELDVDGSVEVEHQFCSLFLFSLVPLLDHQHFVSSASSSNFGACSLVTGSGGKLKATHEL